MGECDYSFFRSLIQIASQTRNFDFGLRIETSYGCHVFLHVVITQNQLEPPIQPLESKHGLSAPAYTYQSSLDGRLADVKIDERHPLSRR